MTFRKRFPIKGEERFLAFRVEMYNIFNHTQFIAATNGSTGSYTNTVNPRLMSFALRFQF